MAKKPIYEDKMRLDMPFAEALERFIGTDPKEMHANIRRAKRRSRRAGRKPRPAGRLKAKAL